MRHEVLIIGQLVGQIDEDAGLAGFLEDGLRHPCVGQNHDVRIFGRRDHQLQRILIAGRGGQIEIDGQVQLVADLIEPELADIAVLAPVGHHGELVVLLLALRGRADSAAQSQNEHQQQGNQAFLGVHGFSSSFYY